MEFYCPNCKMKYDFEELEGKRPYKCPVCFGEFKKCTTKGCKTLLKKGILCSDCLGNPIKNMGKAVLPSLALGILVRILRKK